MVTPFQFWRNSSHISRSDRAEGSRITCESELGAEGNNDNNLEMKALPWGMIHIAKFNMYSSDCNSTLVQTRETVKA